MAGVGTESLGMGLLQGAGVGAEGLEKGLEMDGIVD